MRTEIKITGNDEILRLMKEAPDNVEREVNAVLHKQGGKEISQSIIGFMPISKRDKSNWRQNSSHAKTSNSLSQTKLNLAVQIYAKGGASYSKGSFGYLVFPNEGRGRSNPVSQQFFEKGLEAKEQTVIDLLIKALDKAI